MLLTYVCHANFTLFQMDIKSVVLNGFIMGKKCMLSNHKVMKIFIFPIMFSNLKRHCMVYNKHLACHDRLKSFLIDNNFNLGKIDTIFFTKRKGKDILIVQIYVDDIIFGITNESLCKDFVKHIQDELEMNMMRELNFILRSQIKQEKIESSSTKTST
jgi:hypothetical protein